MERQNEKEMAPLSSFRKGVLLFDEKNWKNEFDEWNIKNNNVLNEWLSTGEVVRIYDWEYIQKDRLLQMEDYVKRFFKIIATKKSSVIYEIKDEIILLSDKKVNQVQNMLSQYFSPYENGQKWKESLFNCTKCILEQPKKIIEIVEKTPDNLTKEQRISYQYYLIKSDIPIYDFDLPFELGCSNLKKLVDAHISANENKRPLLNIFLFLEQFVVDLRDFNRYKFNLLNSSYFVSFLGIMMKFRALYKMAYGDFISTNIDRTIREILPPSKRKSQSKSSEEVAQNNDEFPERIDEILYKMFPHEMEMMLNQFKDALLGHKKPGFVEVKYVGTKESLYKHLGKLRKAGIDRRVIATVFSNKCKFKRNLKGQEKSLNYNDLYRKMK